MHLIGNSPYSFLCLQWKQRNLSPYRSSIFMSHWGKLCVQWIWVIVPKSAVLRRIPLLFHFSLRFHITRALWYLPLSWRSSKLNCLLLFWLRELHTLCEDLRLNKRGTLITGICVDLIIFWMGIFFVQELVRSILILFYLQIQIKIN